MYASLHEDESLFDFRDKVLGWSRVGLYILSFCKSEGIFKPGKTCGPAMVLTLSGAVSSAPLPIVPDWFLH